VRVSTRVYVRKHIYATLLQRYSSTTREKMAPMGGAAPSQVFNPVKDLPSMQGKVVIVTGSRCVPNQLEERVGRPFYF